MPLGEFEIIKKYFHRQVMQSSVVKSVGDDCAILSHSENKHLVMSMDTMVCGRHFPEDMDPYHIGSRALCTSLSDLAAMGAKPLYFTLGLTLPNASEEWLASFSAGLFSIAEKFSCDLIGGDTTQGPLTITVQVHGEVDKGSALRRDAALIGDAVFVTGTLGDGAAALALLQGKREEQGPGSELKKKESLDSGGEQYLLQRFYAPLPQILAGQKLLSYANAAIDISDGLLADAQHIADNSQVGINIDVERLPISVAAKHFGVKDCYSWALTGGDDYQLLFTVSQEHLNAIQKLIEAGDLDATHIGEVVKLNAKLDARDQSSVNCFLNGEPYQKNNNNIDNDSYAGYQHFAS